MPVCLSNALSARRRQKFKWSKIYRKLIKYLNIAKWDGTTRKIKQQQHNTILANNYKHIKLLGFALVCVTGRGVRVCICAALVGLKIWCNFIMWAQNLHIKAANRETRAGPNKWVCVCKFRDTHTCQHSACLCEFIVMRPELCVCLCHKCVIYEPY